jgi:hypothetical protein
MENCILERETGKCVQQTQWLALVAVIEILSCDGSLWLVTDLNYSNFFSQQKDVNRF